MHWTSIIADVRLVVVVFASPYINSAVGRIVKKKEHDHSTFYYYVL